jgi:polar amino acid transport system substrate-binding protein
MTAARAVLLGLSILLLAACSSEADSGRPATTASERVMTTVDPAELTTPGKLRACVDAGSPPFAFVEARSHRLRGFEVDLLQRISRRLGLELSWVRASRSQLVPSLQASRCDVIVSRLGYSLDSQLKDGVGALSYMEVPLDLVSPAGGGDGPAAMADLCSLRIAVVTWTTAAFYAAAQQRACSSLSIGEAETSEAALDLVRRGRADAVLDDAVSAPRARGFQVRRVQDQLGHIALGFTQGSTSLTTGIRAVLLTLYEDGYPHGPIGELLDRYRLRHAVRMQTLP